VPHRFPARWILGRAVKRPAINDLATAVSNGLSRAPIGRMMGGRVHPANQTHGAWRRGLPDQAIDRERLTALVLRFRAPARQTRT
jgi:hypothetical protein